MLALCSVALIVVGQAPVLMRKRAISLSAAPAFCLPANWDHMDLTRWSLASWHLRG